MDLTGQSLQRELFLNIPSTSFSSNNACREKGLFTWKTFLAKLLLEICLLFTDILTKDHQNLKTLVSTLPEHSDSDLNGHITNEKLFGSNNVTLGDAEEDEVDSWKNFGIWIEFCLNSPLIIGVFIGTIIFLILLIIGFCLVCKICRWVRV